MSAPVVELTPEERAEIHACERAIGELYERMAAVRRDAALRDGIDPAWLACHT